MVNFEQPAYRNLRSIVRERTNRLVVWIGSGLSVPAGLPTWAELKQSLCTALLEKANTLDTPERMVTTNAVDQIRNMQDYWLAFQLLRKNLGPTTYREEIRRKFEPAETAKIPEAYGLVLGLPVSGMLTLNIDRLATRAFSIRFPGSALVEFSGKAVGNFVHVLKGSTPFLVNLHGICADESSWVFTRDELKDLLRVDSYRSFIEPVSAQEQLSSLGSPPMTSRLADTSNASLTRVST